MLKLEKASSDRQISVIVRDKEYFLTHSFLIAFALAAGFHFLFLLIFHIAPFKIRWSETIFPPIQVEASSFKDFAVMIDAEPAAHASSGLPQAKPSSPILPEHPTVLALRQMEYIKENANPDNPFAQIEQGIYQPVFTPLAKPNPPPVSLVISRPWPIKASSLMPWQIKSCPQLPLQSGVRNCERSIMYLPKDVPAVFSGMSLKSSPILPL